MFDILKPGYAKKAGMSGTGDRCSNGTSGMLGMRRACQMILGAWAYTRSASRRARATGGLYKSILYASVRAVIGDLEWRVRGGDVGDVSRYGANHSCCNHV